MSVNGRRSAAEPGRWGLDRYSPAGSAWLQAHGDDRIEVKLIDLLHVVARLAALAEDRYHPQDIILLRLASSDLPRLRACLPGRALDEI